VTPAPAISIAGDRWPLFWSGCAAIAIGVALHLPMLAEAHRMGNHLAGMAMDVPIMLGMALILIGVPAAIVRALPRHRRGRRAGVCADRPDPDVERRCAGAGRAHGIVRSNGREGRAGNPRPLAARAGGDGLKASAKSGIGRGHDHA
jgi:hypothetical protein